MYLESSRSGEASAEDVERALKQHLNDQIEYVILNQSDDAFMQVSGDWLEYRDESGHYRVPEDQCDQELIRRAFLSYLSGDGKYKQFATWEPLQEERFTLSAGMIIAAIIALAIVGAVIYRSVAE